MPTEINGLPAHVLLVHVVVVMVPLAALALLLSVAWPAARRRLGVVTPLLALVALVAVPVTTHAGEWLQRRIPSSPLIAKHAALGDQLLPWVAGLFVVALAHWVWSRSAGRHAVDPGPAGAGSGTSTPGATSGGGTAVAERTSVRTERRSPVVTAVFAVLALVVAVGSVWMVYRIGDSGAQAIWSGTL